MTKKLKTQERVGKDMVQIVTETTEELIGFTFTATWTTSFDKNGNYNDTTLELRNKEGYRVGRSKNWKLADCPQEVKDNVTTFSDNMAQIANNL